MSPSHQELLLVFRRRYNLLGMTAKVLCDQLSLQSLSRVSHSSPVEAGWTHQGKTCVHISYSRQICPLKEGLGIVMG